MTNVIGSYQLAGLSNFLQSWLGSIGSSVYAFLLFSFLALAVYYLFPVRARLYVLAAESFMFYALCDVRFLGLVIFETIVTWMLGRAIAAHLNKGKDAGLPLVVGIIFVIGILAVFKYAGFFSGIIFSFVNKQFSPEQMLMPAGISYYSFREVSYLADIRVGKRKQEKSLLRYMVYVLFFPQIISGPIARSEGILEKIQNGLSGDLHLAGEGVLLIISGMFKKVVIADRIGDYVNTIFGSWQSYPSEALWLAMVLNAVYIYCDFAGYSEIAVGITRMFGFPCEKNFDKPYLSQNMREFWRRWHISLSQWLRDYVYIPLGGSRISRRRTNWNVMLVFIVCGLWHGSGFTYLVWGIYHGICNILTPRSEKRPASSTQRAASGSFSAFLHSVCVFVAAMFGWLLFRSSSLTMCVGFFCHLFNGFTFSFNALVAAILPFTNDNTSASFFLTLVLMILVLFMMEWQEMYDPEKWEMRTISRNCLLIVLIVLFGVTGSSGFLYANY